MKSKNCFGIPKDAPKYTFNSCIFSDRFFDLQGFRRRFKICCVLLAALAQWPAVNAQLEPVDGRLGTWNTDWRRLENTVEYPRGVTLMALLAYTPFKNVKLVVISDDNQGDVIAYVGQSDVQAFLPEEKDVPKVDAKKCRFDRQMAKRINALWAAMLKNTRYSDSSGLFLTMDGALCYAGGTDLKRPHIFLMGKFMLVEDSEFEAVWMKDMSDAVADFVNAQNPDKQKKIMEKIQALVVQKEKINH